MTVNVFDYLNYREFLRVYFLEKSNSRSFSFRQFAKKCGITSPGYIRQIFESDVRINAETVDKLTLGLGLGKEEADYFRSLVELNQSARADAAVPGRKRDPETLRDYDIHRRWYYTVIWELATCKNFNLTPESAAQALKNAISIEQARHAIDFLVSNAYLRETLQEHVYVQKKPFLLARGNAETAEQREILRDFHRHFIRMSEQMLSGPQEESLYRGLTIAVSERKFPQIKEKLDQYVNELQVLLASDIEADRVLRININFFPLTNSLGGIK